MKEESQEAEEIKLSNKFMFEDEETISFDPTNPIISFRKMINYNKEDLVSKAFKELNQYILNKVSFSVTEEAYKHLTECASELRKASISEQEQKYWDSWLKEVSVNYSMFFNHLKSQGIGYI